MSQNPWCFYCEKCDLHLRLGDEYSDSEAEALRARIASGLSSYEHTVDGVPHPLQVQRESLQ